MQPLVERFTQAGYACVAPSLPGHEPSDPVALGRLRLPDYLRALEDIRAALPVPPILVGHSMGGLLAQQLAASGPARAVVCLAAAPPGPVRPQIRALPYLRTMLAPFLTGRPFRPSAAAWRGIGGPELPSEEQDEIFETLGYESGLAYRTMVFGLREVRVGPVACPVLCVSGSDDRMISRRISRALARRYDAEHVVLPGRGHWLVARFGADRVADVVLAWLDRQGLGVGSRAAARR